MNTLGIQKNSSNETGIHLREICAPAFYESFVYDLKQLLQTREWNVYKWLHQPYPTPESASGADLWANIVELGHMHNYMLPSIEARLIQDHRELLKNMFSSLRPFGLIAGAGTRWAVMNKEIPVLEAINASAAADWELCPRLGYEAVDCIKNKLGIPSEPLIRDFTEPLEDLDKLSGSSPVLITMFGCTLGNDINLEHIPDNFARTTGYKGFFLVTTDSSRGEQAVAGYQSSLYRDFQNSYWTFAKYMVEDEEFDDLAVQCKPYYVEVRDPHGSKSVYKSVVHRHIVERDTSIRIEGERYFLKKGTEFKIGRSQKWTPEDIRAPFAKAGWNQLAVMREGTVSAVLYAGKDTPAEWLAPVMKARKSIQAL